MKNIKTKKTNFKKNILNFEKLIIIDSAIEYVNNTNFWNNIKNFCYVSSYSRKDIIENLDKKNSDYISLDFFYKNNLLKRSNIIKSDNPIATKFNLDFNKWLYFFKQKKI